MWLGAKWTPVTIHGKEGPAARTGKKSKPPHQAPQAWETHVGKTNPCNIWLGKPEGPTFMNSQ